MAESKRKCRQYNVEYLKYGFIQSPTNITLPMCLICPKVFSNEAMKPSRLQEHLIKVHANKKNMDLFYVQTLEKKFLKQPKLVNMFSATSKQDDDGLRASYNISLLIAKSEKPHTIGKELILPAINEVIKTVLHKPAFDIIKTIPLSNNTVQRRIDEMAQNIEDILCEYLKTTQFSIQLDESTLPGNEAILLAYVRFMKEQKICQELLFAKNLITDTKGESIFRTLEDFFEEKGIPICNILSVATDGALAIIGRYRGFIAYLKKIVPNLFAVHCVIHRQLLVSENLSERLHMSLHYVITAINKIKNNSLNDRRFGQLCTENDEEFNRLLFHITVRWLSKDACLDRFYKLFNSVLEFLKNRDDILRGNLIDFKSDIAYLTDLFKKFNESNLQLQGDDLNLIKTKNIISAFVVKLHMYKRNLGRKEFIQFPNLEQCAQKSDEDLITYCQYLEALHSDFKKRFENILKMKIADWVLDPFSYTETENSTKLEEELRELTINKELKIKFKEGYQEFGCKCRYLHFILDCGLLYKSF